MAATSQLLATNSDDAVDAVAVMSDEPALGARRAADQAGITVPKQMAVTRWGAADVAAPAGLTTVHQDLHAQGADCARIALDHPAFLDPPSRETIIRRSCLDDSLAQTHVARSLRSTGL